MIKLISIALFSLSILLGQLGFNNQSTESDPFSKEQLAEVQKLIDDISEDDWKAIDAGTLYKQNCSSCHGRKGGLGLAGAANLKESKLDTVNKFAMVYFGKGTMKSYKDVMNPAEILSLSNYLEGLLSK